MPHLFRVDKRDFNVGDVAKTAAEYFDKFPPETKLLEERFELFRPTIKPPRRECLFLFESLDAARNHWSIMTDGKLYKTDVPNDAILHRGDMRLLDVIADKTKAGESTKQTYVDYWNGVMTGEPIIEIMVASAPIIDIVSKDQEERITLLKKRWKME